MKTEDLIGLLAADAFPVRRHAASRRLALAAGRPLSAPFARSCTDRRGID